MPYVAVVAGCILIAVASLLAQRAARLDEQVRPDRLRERVEKPPFPADDRLNYRPSAWALLSARRSTIGGAFILALAGMVLLMYGCPLVARSH